MSLISVIVILLVFCVAFWLTARYAPAEPPIRWLLFAVLGLLFIVWLLMLLGLTGPLGTLHLR
jgi:hypothetical protein